MLSIITPCYNSSKDISRLIISLQNQNNKNFEWIVVDDCSEITDYEKLKSLVDESGILCRFIRNEKNMGSGFSRNKAISEANGSYIVFVDSDDFVTSDFVNELMQNCEKTNCDILIFDYYKTSEKRMVAKNTIPLLDEGFISVNDTLLQVTSSVWGKCYKKAIVDKQQISFPALKRFEDWVFNSLCILNSEKILYHKRNLYHYVINPTSITHCYKKNVYQYSFEAYKMLENALLKLDKEIAEFLYVKYIIYVAAVNEGGYKTSTEMNELFSALMEKVPQWNKNKYLCLLNKYQKLILFLVEHKMFVFLKLFLKMVRRG